MANAKQTKVRVIADQGEFKINDVIAMDEAEAAAAVAAGWADSSADAVKYGESLGKPADPAAE